MKLTLWHPGTLSTTGGEGGLRRPEKVRVYPLGWLTTRPPPPIVEGDPRAERRQAPSQRLGWTPWDGRGVASEEIVGGERGRRILRDGQFMGTPPKKNHQMPNRNGEGSKTHEEAGAGCWLAMGATKQERVSEDTPSHSTK